MTDAARKAKREYDRQWRATHKESVQRSNAKYWARKAKEMGFDDSPEGEGTDKAFSIENEEENSGDE